MKAENIQEKFKQTILNKATKRELNKGNEIIEINLFDEITNMALEIYDLYADESLDAFGREAETMNIFEDYGLEIEPSIRRQHMDNLKEYYGPEPPAADTPVIDVKQIIKNAIANRKFDRLFEEDI